jgi:putative colanic acid biosynthesis acetyltransferase WcaF
MTPLDAALSRPLDGGPSFSLGNRLLRLVWGFTWLVLCRFTPPPLHAWRRTVLRLFGARIGKGARVHASAKIWLPANLEIGERALVGPGSILYNQGRIAIGAGSVISQRAHLCASSHDISDPHFQLVLRPIVIGSGCWIAAEAFVGPGVQVGDGAVVGARAALFSDAEPNGIYSGNPAILIKRRKLR